MPSPTPYTSFVTSTCTDPVRVSLGLVRSTVRDDTAHRRALAVDFDADAVESKVKDRCGKVGELPDARGCRKAATVDGNPGAALDSSCAAGVIGDAGDYRFQDDWELGRLLLSGRRRKLPTTGTFPAVTARGTVRFT